VRRQAVERAVGDLKFETRLSAEERVVERGMHLSVVRKDRRKPRQLMRVTAANLAEK